MIHPPQTGHRMKCSASSLGGLPVRRPMEVFQSLLRRWQYGELTSLQVPHGYLATRVLTLEKSCSPHRRKHRVSAGFGFSINQDFESSSYAVVNHLPQSSLRLTADRRRRRALELEPVQRAGLIGAASGAAWISIPPLQIKCSRRSRCRHCRHGTLIAASAIIKVCAVAGAAQGALE